MTANSKNLNLVRDSQPPSPMSAEEFAASFMKLATSLVDFERGHQNVSQDKKFRVASLSSLRMPRPVEQNQGQDQDLSKTEPEAATVMAFKTRQES